MAWTYGTATDYRDLLGRLIDFLTGHPDLVASGQNWTLMRLFAPIAQFLGSVANPQLAFDANTTADVVSSDPFPQWVGVHTACRFEPQTYLVRASASNPGASPRDFALEWSDDGISWTAADTRTGMTWTAGERKDFTLAAPAGAHSYWRLRVDATAAGTLAMATIEFLLPADGLNGVINSSYTSGAPQAVFRAPGLAGAEEIYCGVRAFQDATAGWYFWDLQGFIGFNPANDFYVQPGAVGGWNVGVSLWNAPIPYWFVANGRRVVMVAKVSTVYEAAYLGFIKPYATPGQYPYPLLAGGSMTGQRGRNYSVTSPNHRHFVDPGEDGQNNANTACMLRGPSGAWLPFQNSYYSSAEYRYDGPRPVWPTNYGYLGNVREAPDGRYVLSPVVLTQNNSGTDHDLFGELDGCYWVSGFNNAAENLINVGGVDHLVVQNVYRTSVRDYWALRLE